MQRDYKRIDLLADALNTRFPPSEICELARSQDVIVRELAKEALAAVPFPCWRAYSVIRLIPRSARGIAQAS
jgi:hypothetical protein